MNMESNYAMRYIKAFRALNCDIQVYLETTFNGDEILRDLPAQVEDIESHLSRFRHDSELSRLNAAVGDWLRVSRLLLANIVTAKQAAQVTEGLYNPLILDTLIAAGYDRSFQLLPQSRRSSIPSIQTVANWRDIEIDIVNERVKIPAKIDLGGVAKGWLAEKIAKQLSIHGACLVSIGGDIAVRGRSSHMRGWEISVAQPTKDKGDILHVLLSDGSIATSGTVTRRWIVNGYSQHHIIDPRTGKPATTDILSATVIHPVALIAESYAKAIVILGSKAGLDWLKSQGNVAVHMTLNDYTVKTTSGFLDFVTAKSLG